MIEKYSHGGLVSWQHYKYASSSYCKDYSIELTVMRNEPISSKFALKRLHHNKKGVGINLNSRYSVQ